MKYTILYTLLTLVAAARLCAEPGKAVEIRLASNPASGLTAQRDKPVEFSPKRASKFRVLPGIANATCNSLELVGAKGYFLRHQNSVCFVRERPKLNAMFDEDATFKIINLDGGKVRFESTNYPGMYITVRDDGSVITSRNPDLLKSTFVYKIE